MLGVMLLLAMSSLKVLSRVMTGRVDCLVKVCGREQQDAREIRVA